MINLHEERKIKHAQTAEQIARLKKYWLMYFALLGTGTLSALSGFLLAHAPDENGVADYTLVTIAAGVFYMIGFLTTGEGATLFWFDKLTDHDEDNTAQLYIAWLMMALSIITSLVTASAAAAFVAYWMGELDAFQVMPLWAQNWVVWAIPVLWITHFVCGTIFKTISDEARQMRQLATIQRSTQMEIRIARERAKTNVLRREAPVLAQRLGESDAHQQIGYMTREILADDRNGDHREHEVVPTPRR